MRHNHVPGGVLEGSPVDIKESIPVKAPGKLNLWLVLLVVAGIAAIVAVFALRPKEPAKAAASDTGMVIMTVSTLPAHLETIDRHLSADGSISAWDPLAISAEVAQLRVDGIYVDEGSLVKKGQILARLNSSVLDAQLAQQKAHLLADQAALRKSIQPNRVEDLNTWKAALQQSEATLAQEEANLIRARANAANQAENARRYTELCKVGAVSQMDTQAKLTDSRTSAADVAAAEKRVEAMKFSLRQAHEKLQMAEKGGRQEDIDISRSTLAETNARIAQLEAQIAQTIIKAPTSGKIIKREVHLGEISSIGKNMFTMVRDGRLEMRALIPEIDLPRLKPGMPVKMTASGDGGETVSGCLREISPSVDEKTRLGVARIDVNGPQSLLRPGLFYHADIDLGQQKALVVPSRSVLNRNEKDVVFVYSNGQAVLRPVRVGEPLPNGGIEIMAGLAPGQEVIVSGAGFMKDGDRVRSVAEKSAVTR
jgi:HlyD family secretion protein